MSRNYEWDIRFLRMAEHIASWSKDPSTQSGAVIVDQDRRIISLGYNGLPQGVLDKPERLDNREVKYKIIVHSERNAIIFAERSLKNCTLYTWPLMSCATCASMVIQAGIKCVVAPVSDNPRWQYDFQLSKEMFLESGVEVVLIEGLSANQHQPVTILIEGPISRLLKKWWNLVKKLFR